ncbi:hypothetical protein ACVWXL_001351 [Bradyrhizobium sp. GM22.5]
MIIWRRWRGMPPGPRKPNCRENWSNGVASSESIRFCCSIALLSLFWSILTRTEMTAGLTLLTRSPKPGGVAAVSAAWAGAMKEVALNGEEPGAVASTATPSAATVPSSASRRGLRTLRDVVVSELT